LQQTKEKLVEEGQDLVVDAIIELASIRRGRGNDPWRVTGRGHHTI